MSYNSWISGRHLKNQVFKPSLCHYLLNWLRLYLLLKAYLCLRLYFLWWRSYLLLSQQEKHHVKTDGYGSTLKIALSRSSQFIIFKQMTTYLKMPTTLHLRILSHTWHGSFYGRRCLYPRSGISYGGLFIINWQWEKIYLNEGYALRICVLYVENIMRLWSICSWNVILLVLYVLAPHYPLWWTSISIHFSSLGGNIGWGRELRD